VLAAGLPKKFAMVSAGENMSIPFSETGREWVPPVSVTQSNACATRHKNLFPLFFQGIKFDQGGSKFSRRPCGCIFYPGRAVGTANFAILPVAAPADNRSGNTA
jgi:hypothetical protein